MSDILNEQFQTVIDVIDDEIKITKIQSKNTIDSCDKNYFSGYIDALAWVKQIIKI